MADLLANSLRLPNPPDSNTIAADTKRLQDMVRAATDYTLRVQRWLVQVRQVDQICRAGRVVAETAHDAAVAKARDFLQTLWLVADPRDFERCLTDGGAQMDPALVGERSALLHDYFRDQPAPDFREAGEELEAKVKLEALKARQTWLAEAQGAEAAAPPAVAPAAPPAKLASRRQPTVNARMLETIQTNSEAMGWNSRQWAEHLKCSKPAVVETQTWRDLTMRRERNRAERAKDRRRRPKGSDKRRD
jgi:hypothetical protein